MLKDKDIKALAINKLVTDGIVDRGVTLANELSLPSGCRADLAIAAEQFIGLEIKGPKDSLRRLDSQLDSYNLVFDRTIVVAATRHIPKLMFKIGDFELWEVISTGGIIVHSRMQYKTSRTISRRNFFDGLPKKAKQMSAIGMLDGCEREAFIKNFMQKFRATSAEFWRNFDSSRIGTEHIASLNPNFARHLMNKEKTRHVEEFWKSWQIQATQMFA